MIAAVSVQARAEYRFSWWHQGLMLYDRSVTFVAPGGDLFGASDAPLVVERLDREPALDPDAESVADFDLSTSSGTVDLAPSGGMEGITAVEVPSGRWRARWSGFGETAATERAYPADVLDGPDRPDRYMLQLWPSAAPAPVAIRR